MPQVTFDLDNRDECLDVRKRIDRTHNLPPANANSVYDTAISCTQIIHFGRTNGYPGNAYFNAFLGQKTRRYGHKPFYLGDVGNLTDSEVHQWFNKPAKAKKVLAVADAICQFYGVTRGSTPEGWKRPGLR